MLKYLHIENIAVIERADIDLAAGLHVMTGETGAGKSIVIDAINAVLGERTSKELIRAGCDRAEVSAQFCGLNDTARKALQEGGFSADEDGIVIIRRVLSAAGSGSIRINGSPATAGVLREIGRSFVDIHGQHDNRNLLDPQRHCDYIDRLAENDVLLQEYYTEFRRLNALRRELQSLESDEDEKQRRIDLLQYQIRELEAAALHEGEIEELRRKLAIAENYEHRIQALNQADLLLNGSDDTDGAISLLTWAEKQLAGVDDPVFANDRERLNDALSALADISADIRDFTENSEYSELDGNEIRERLDFIRRLMLKYGNSESEMLAFLQRAREELQGIVLADSRAAELSEELDRSTERLIELGEQLTASRKQAAETFAAAVTDVLRYLDMPNVRFTVDFAKGRYTKTGCDEVQFLVSANAGEDVKPLAKIASGGELSRIMLAIKSVLADKDDVETLIFDEIDTGISGRAAAKVGRQLKQVSRNRQVICVTHLAQIAAFADQHLLIEKNTQNGRTFTKVFPLSEEQRVGEIARIMAGGELTENLRNSARELLDRSKNDDNL